MCSVPCVVDITLLGKILTREIMGGENVAEIVQNRQFLPVIILPVTSACLLFVINCKN